MNVILVMVDSLNRTYLSPYGNEWIQTPNFERLAQRCVTVESHWTGSPPTMPTRHEVMAGRHEYLWRPWGPLEPFDVTLAQLCRGSPIAYTEQGMINDQPKRGEPSIPRWALIIPCSILDIGLASGARSGTSTRDPRIPAERSLS